MTDRGRKHRRNKEDPGVHEENPGLANPINHQARDRGTNQASKVKGNRVQRDRIGDRPCGHKLRNKSLTGRRIERCSKSPTESKKVDQPQARMPREDHDPQQKTENSKRALSDLDDRLAVHTVNDDTGVRAEE